ncbi:MAG: hypothetical protein KKF43_11020, partial [Proteobacteria bacterium]|nr:hypothetical protein [Pseudomonadota bacterium]
MRVAHVPQAKSLNQQPFSPPENLSQGTEALNLGLKNPLIEKCLKQLGNQELLGGPYVKDYL